MKTQTTQHTPGPWIDDDGLVKDARGRHIVVPLEWQPESMIRANARLIAAGPDMLEALKQCLHDIDYQHDICGEESCHLCHAYHVAEKAIAKAEGRS